ncbi:hypothetical protein KORDIASMS9_02250 [Kordia sp. SMS9]|uniref:hypothetical protein n=1 Tax=Kordia sp. SMS9 TaxID=2282170 RepID=UPI000E106471|nr:hypothetical protein [Kordia sp. SMS9]AXG70021.1 hypothetical protein KORDIASMS9_02250 [Kordia sp. SMS9]
MIFRKLETVTVQTDAFTTWEISMLIIGIGCFGILIFLSILLYNYVHRFDLDDELHR